MKNYKRIRRIFENAELPQPELQQVAPAQSFAMETPLTQVEPAQPSSVPALPPVGGISAPLDPMTMTVKDFLDKVKALDPLVSMGIESYIEKNMGSFTEPAVPEQPMMPAAPEPDLTFSSQVPAPEPTLDFPAA
jgi:hypothetical protein